MTASSSKNSSFFDLTKHLGQTECLYQLVESMQRPAERKKMKPCTNIYRAWHIIDESHGDDDRLVDILLRDVENLNTYTTKGELVSPKLTNSLNPYRTSLHK